MWVMKHGDLDKVDNDGKAQAIDVIIAVPESPAS